MKSFSIYCSVLVVSTQFIEYGIFGEGSHIPTNQKRENGAFSLLIGRNTRPVLYNVCPLQRPRENSNLATNQRNGVMNRFNLGVLSPSLNTETRYAVKQTKPRGNRLGFRPHKL